MGTATPTIDRRPSDRLRWGAALWERRSSPPAPRTLSREHKRPMEAQVAFSSGGGHIFGVLHVPERTPAPGLLMNHGFTGSKSEAHRLFIHTARDLCAHGLAVLRFDFRGSGDSGGEFRDMTIEREIADAHAAFNFLADRPEVDPQRLGVLGLSLGGCVSACLAGRESRVKALVLWAALAHPGRIFDRRSADFGEADWVDMDGWGLGRAFVEEARHLQPLEEVKAYRGPCLIVHGVEDQSVPISDAEDYSATLGDRSRLHRVPGSDHTFSSFPWTREAVGQSRAFLLQALGLQE